MNLKIQRRPIHHSRQRGMTLIELMVALVLGLLVIGAAGMIFLSNSQAYNTTETLGRIQENGRVAFELMARDLREAGATACGKDLPVANTLNNPTGSDLYEWGDGLRGYGGTQPASLAPFGDAPGRRVSGTEAVELRSGGGGGVTVTKHNPASAVIHVNTADHGFEEGDVLIVCDYSQASIFEMSPGGDVSHVGHNTGNSKFDSGGTFAGRSAFLSTQNAMKSRRTGRSTVRPPSSQSCTLRFGISAIIPGEGTHCTAVLSGGGRKKLPKALSISISATISRGLITSPPQQFRWTGGMRSARFGSKQIWRQPQVRFVMARSRALTAMY